MSRRSKSLLNLKMDVPALHPSHRQKVDERPPHPVSNIVLGFTKRPRIVGYRDLDDLIPLHLHQGGQEPVHPIELWNFLEAFLLKDAKGTDAVVDLLAAHPVSNSVGNLLRDTLQPGVTPLPTPSSGHVIAIQISQQLGDIRRVILEI